MARKSTVAVIILLSLIFEMIVNRGGQTFAHYRLKVLKGGLADPLDTFEMTEQFGGRGLADALYLCKLRANLALGPQ